MPAAKTPAEHDNKGRKKTHTKYPSASRSHEPIVAAGHIFDK
jgi:hypothetical protein